VRGRPEHRGEATLGARRAERVLARDEERRAGRQRVERRGEIGKAAFATASEPHDRRADPRRRRVDAAPAGEDEAVMRRLPWLNRQRFRGPGRRRRWCRLGVEGDDDRISRRRMFRLQQRVQRLGRAIKDFHRPTRSLPLFSPQCTGGGAVTDL
jgi:hypothetical protein